MTVGSVACFAAQFPSPLEPKVIAIKDIGFLGSFWWGHILTDQWLPGGLGPVCDNFTLNGPLTPDLPIDFFYFPDTHDLHVAHSRIDGAGIYTLVQDNLDPEFYSLDGRPFQPGWSMPFYVA